MNKIAIIGGGAVGIAILHYLIEGFLGRSTTQPIEIVLFEKAKKIGPGLAYSADSDTNILNRSAQTMSVVYDQPNSFFSWLQENSYKYNDELNKIDLHQNENIYLPRRIFGKYLEDFFYEILKQAKNSNISIKTLNSEVISLAQLDDIHIVETQDNNCYKFNTVVLALGNMPSVKYPNIIHSEKYFISPYPIINLINTIPKQARVGILGSRLSAIDVAVGLKENKHIGKLAFISRSGYLPSVKTNFRNYQLKILTHDLINSITNAGNKTLRLSTVVNLITEEVSIASGVKVKITDWFSRSKDPITFLEQELINPNEVSNIWNDIFVSLNDVIETLWQQLSLEDKSLFVKYIKNKWMAYRVGIPEKNARKILNLFKNRELELISNFAEIQYNKNNNLFNITTHQNINHAFDYIIDASGYYNSIQSIESKLIKNMIKNEVITPHRFGGIDVDFKSSRVINKKREVQKSLYAIGNLTQGVHLFTSVLELNSKNAQNIAQNILHTIN